MFFCLCVQQTTTFTGSAVVECLTRDRGAAGSNLAGVTALCPGSRPIYPSLVLVQPRKTGPYIAERLLMGHKESKQATLAKLHLFREYSV